MAQILTTDIEYEMGYEADEFSRVLSESFCGAQSVYHCQRIESCHWRVSQTGEVFTVDIRISVMPVRKLGPLIRMPVLQVRFHLEPVNQQLQARFFKRFAQYFHKGGG